MSNKPETSSGRDELGVDLEDDETRRELLKKVAGVGAVGLVGSTAGCSGNGSDGDDGTGSDGSSGSQETIRLIMPPTGFQGIIMEQLVDETDVLQQHFQEYNLDVELNQSYEGAALFTSGGADFGTFGSLEAAAIAGERDIPLTCNANLAPFFPLVMGRRDGEYTPDVTGGPQESWNKLVENDVSFAFSGWGGGTAAVMSVAMPTAYGYDINEDQGESDINVTTAETFVVPQLVAEGQVKLGGSSPVHGAVSYMTGDSPELAKVAQFGEDVQSELGSTPQYNSWTCTQEMTESTPGAAEAVVQGMNEGTSWFFANPIDIVNNDTYHQEQLGITDPDNAEFVLEWGVNLSQPGPWENEIPIIYEDLELTDQFIEGDKEFLQNAIDVGFFPESALERLQYRQVDQEGSGDYTL